MRGRSFARGIVAVMALAFACALPRAAAPSKPAARERVIIDTDIGDDIDDAFAVALALHSDELQIDGVTTAWGDTRLRAKLVNRLLRETGREEIPVAQGIVTKPQYPFTQSRWAMKGADPKLKIDAPDFLLQEIRAHPGEITLIAIGPLTNIGAAIDREPATFRKLKRIVMMGGSIRRGYDDANGHAVMHPDAEYNIHMDPAAAQKVFQSGVPIFMMPLDSTQLRLEKARRDQIFHRGTPITNDLRALYLEWGKPTPVLFDPMAVAYAIDPSVCPVTPLHADVDKDGFTREGPGATNVSACLASSAERFFRFAMPRFLAKPQKN